jgi:hypothetical protein
MNTLKTTIGSIAFLLAMTVLPACMDGPEDYQGDWSQSDHLKALQESEVGSARRQAAAQALCREERGPQSEARWLPDGSLVCTIRRGYSKAQVQL